MDPETGQHRLAAIVSADVAGYSRLIERDEAGTVRTLNAYRDEIRLLVGQHSGRVVDAEGDNVLAEFPSALDATRCAIEIQRVLAARNAGIPAKRRLEFRIGIHLGDVLVEGERIYGDGINIAARLEKIADAGGVCLSAAVHDQIEGKLSVKSEDLGEQDLRNISRPVRAYRLDLAEAVGADVAGEIEAQLETLREHRDIAVFVVPAVWVTYVAIVAEILFMISPIALYYYSAYGPSLNVLHTSSATAWLPQFFLPHFSETSSPVLNAIPAVGRVLLLAGVVLFLVSFAQLYFSKLRGGRLVTRGPYVLTPHPQYVALAIAGLGTLLIWPRFIVLVAYVTTLFLYAALARSEEGRCLARFGESYRRYRSGHRRLLPAWLPAFGGQRVAALWALWLACTAAAVVLGFVARDYSLDRISALYEDRTAVLSPALLSDAELGAALDVARADAGVRARLDALDPSAQLLVHVLPDEWAIADIPLVPPEETYYDHHVPSDFPRHLLKLLFTRVRTHASEATGVEIVKRAYGRDPIVMVRVDLAQRTVLSVEEPPAHVFWGDIPTPLY